MPRPRGRWLPLSLPRRLVADAMRACRSVPSVAIERRMDLGELADARRAWSPRPAWSVIHAKAFALVAADVPALRRSFLRWPWPHLYEHPIPVAAIFIERDYHGEEAVFFAQLRRPHQRPLAELDAWLRHCRSAPLAEVASFRRALRLGRLPWPLRPAAMCLGLHASGRLRERGLGTFSLSSVAPQGSGLLQLRTALTATLHYGLFDAAGRLDLRLTFDHRVLDGGTAARALAAMEAALRGPLLAELRRHSGAAPLALPA
jgi:hypothetical protein